MKHCRALDGFLQTRWGKPNAPTTPIFVTISRILPIFSYFDTLITNIIMKITD